MRTFYLCTRDKTSFPFNIPVFVIGVKDDPGCDLDAVEREYEGYIKIERLPETINVKYIMYDEYEQHILQPAFITRIKEQE